LAAENQLYRAQLGEPTQGIRLPEQQERIQSNQAELNTRTAEQSEVEQLIKQLKQNQIQLTSARDSWR